MNKKEKNIANAQDDFFKIIPLEMIRKLAEFQKFRNGESMVIILTEDIIRNLKQGKAADIEMHNAPMGYIIFIPEKLIHNYYEQESTNE